MRLVLSLLLVLSAGFLTAQGYLREPAGLPSGVTALSVTRALVPPGAGSGPSQWPRTLWGRYYTPELRKSAQKIALAYEMPLEVGPDSVLWTLTTAPVHSLWVNGEGRSPDQFLRPGPAGWYIDVPPSWGGKTVVVEHVHWWNWKTKAWFGPRKAVETQARNWIAQLKKYPLSVPLLVKSGPRDGPGEWTWPKDLLEPGLRNRLLSFRVILPPVSVQSATLPWEEAGIAEYRLFLDGNQIADGTQGLVVAKTRFIRLPEDWQGRTLEMEVRFTGPEFVPELGLFDGEAFLTNWIEGLQPRASQLLYGWAGPLTALGLVILRLFRRRDRVLLPLALMLLLLAHLYGPESHRSALAEWTGDFALIFQSMEVCLISLLVFELYGAMIPDRRTGLIRRSWLVLGVATAFLTVLSVLGVAGPPDWPQNLPIGPLQLVFASVTLVWIGYLLASNTVRTPEAAFFAGMGALGLSSVILPLVDGRVFSAGIPQGLLQTWDQGNLLGFFLLLLAMPISQFFRNEALVQAQNRVLVETNQVFRRFVPQQFLDVLGIAEVHQIRLGCQRRLRISVLFADIRGFTRLAEHLDPESTFALINEYLAVMAPIILSRGGYIDKFLGDGVMAVFPGEASEALQASTELHAAVEALNRRREQRGEQPIQVGMGLHSGSAILGTVGHEDRMDSTVISDTVNTAARLESLSKHYGVRVIVSDTTAAEVTDALRSGLLFLDRVTVYGSSNPLTLWESLWARPEEEQEQRQTWAHGYETAWENLHRGDHGAAEAQLAALLAAHGEQTPIRRLQERLESRKAGRSIVDAQGIESLEFK